MKKNVLIILLLICPVLFGQNNFSSRKELPVVRSDVQTQILFYKTNSNYQITYLYKIPYSHIQFENVNDHFESKLELTIEVKNQENKVVKREFIKDKVISYNFDETISNNKFLENFITLDLPKDNYTFQIIFEDKVTNLYRPQKPLAVRLNDSTLNYSPVLVEQRSNSSSKSDKYIVANYSGYIPFSKDLYSLIILSDKFRNNEDYSFQITQNDSVYFKRKLKIKSFGLPVFEKQNESITLSFDSSYVLNGIILNEINKNLTEGDYTIRILDDGDKEIETLKFSVKWFNKPFSLKDSDFALEMISYIEPESSYKELLKSTLNSEKLLEQYWRTKDPTPGTSFNELMEVFYERVDFAEINYRSISESSGAKTDRGKIYIINGKPDRIERGVNYDGKITETWFYENPKRVFIFVDKRGDGSFKLEQ